MTAEDQVREFTALLDRAVAQVTSPDDPVERETAARALGAVLSDAKGQVGSVRARAVRNLVDQGEMSVTMAGRVLGLSRSGVRYLLGQL